MLDKTTNAHEKIIVIGGGLAGLSAAITAAKNGSEVTLLEGARNLGGRAQTTYRDGFAFNFGPHALFNGGHALKALKNFDIEVSGNSPKLAGQHAINKNLLELLPISLSTIWRTGLLTISDKLEITNFYKGLNALNPEPYNGLTLSETVDQLFKSERVKQCFIAMCRLSSYCHAPDLVSGGAMLDQFKISMSGVTYLDDGWQTMVDKLEAKANALGITIEKAARPTSIEKTPEGFQINCSKTAPYMGQAVILALSPTQAQQLAGSLVPELDKAVSEAVSIHLACLDLGLTRPTEPKKTFAIGIDEPFYFSMHSVSAKVAPENGALIHCTKYLTPGENTGRDQLERELTHLMDLLQDGWQGCVQHRFFRPNMLVSNWLPLAKNNGLMGRPHHETQQPGIYIAGDWVGNTGQLSDASFASGVAAGNSASQFVKDNMCDALKS